MDVKYERGEYDAEQVGRSEAIFEAITDPLFIVDAQHNVRNMNQAARDLLGMDSTGWPVDGLCEQERCFELYDLQGRPLPDDQWPQMSILRGAVLREEMAIDVMMRLRDGRTRFLSVTGAPVYTDTGEVSAAVLVCRDATERRRVEDALRQSEERFRTAFDGAAIGITITDLHLRFLQVNAAYCAITGYTEEELLQTDLMSITHPEDRAANEAAVRDLLSGKIPGFVTQKRYIRKDGSSVWVQNSVSITYDRWGQPYSLTALTEDITEQRERLTRERAEALARELALREINRKTDEFISIISHELKSPLTTIKGNIQLARRHTNKLLTQDSVLAEEVVNPLSQVQHFLERAEHHILMQTRLINDLLDVSRIHANRLELQIERRDLVPMLREAVEDQLHLSFNRDISLAIEAPHAFVMADADRVGQVLNNYLSNALKYSDKNKPVKVRLCCTDTHARVEVIDEGPGLSVQQQERIWESFYRVPEVEVKSGSGVGLGLGLHICRTIIERQGGHVGVESIQGQGSTFWFDLPLTE